MKYPLGNPPFQVSLHIGDTSPVEAFHTGTDNIGHSKTIYSVTEGTVLFSGADPKFPDRGKGVKISHPWIDHRWCFIIRYWHIQDPYVSIGQHVSEGQELGITTSHLHYDIQIPDDGQGNSQLGAENGYRFTDPPIFLDMLYQAERNDELKKWLDDSNEKKENWKKWCREWELTANKHGIEEPEVKCASYDLCEPGG